MPRMTDTAFALPQGDEVDSRVGLKTAIGAAWMVLLRTAFRALGLVSSLILVRLLSPQDFGIVALATVAFSTLDLATEFSIGLALVKMRNPERRHYDTAQTLMVLRGFLIGALMALLAHPLAAFLDEPRIVPVIYVLTVWPVLQGFENVALIDFQRDFQYGKIFRFQLIGKLVGFCVVIPLAYWTRSYWSIAIGAFAARFVTVPLSYAIHPYRPRPSLQALNELFSFSKWLLITNMLSMINDYLMVFLLGRIGGAASVGLYQVAGEVAALPASEVATPVRRVAYVGYAKVHDDTDKLRAQFLSGISLLLMMIVPASVGIAAAGELVTYVGLGSQWTAAVPIVRMCALYTLIDAIGQFTHNVYIVKDRQALYVRVMAVNIASRVAITVAAGLYGGMLWAVGALLATSVVNAAQWFAQLAPILQFRLRDLVAGTWRTIVAALAMTVLVRAELTWWPAAPGTAILPLQALVVCGSGALLHVGVQVSLWLLAGRPDGPERQCLDRLPGLKRRLRFAARAAA